jgi:hypothetical protein
LIVTLHTTPAAQVLSIPSQVAASVHTVCHGCVGCRWLW